MSDSKLIDISYAMLDSSDEFCFPDKDRDLVEEAEMLHEPGNSNNLTVDTKASDAYNSRQT